MNRRKEEKKSAIRAGCLLLALGLGCVFATISAAEGKLAGEGQIGRRDLEAQTLEISGHVYRITERTRIRNRTGLPISLASLDIPDIDGPNGLFPVLAGKFSAVEVGGSYQLESLDLVEPPR